MRSSSLVKYFKQSGNFEVTTLTNQIDNALIDSGLLNFSQYIDHEIKYKRRQRSLVFVFFTYFYKKISVFFKKSSKNSITTPLVIKYTQPRGFLNLIRALELYIRFFSDKRFSKRIYKLVKKEIQIKNYDFVMSSYGPMLPHLIARRIKIENDIIWLADFRDPVYQLTTHSLLFNLYKSYSHRVYSLADRITIVSNSISKQLGINDTNKVIFLPNGYDNDYLIASIEKNSDLLFRHRDRFVIALAGTYYANTSLVPLFTQLRKLILSGFIDESYLHFVFHVNSAENISKDLLSIIPNASFEINPIIDRREIINKGYHLFDLMVVLTYGFNEFIDSIPGKIYEYIGLNKYVLGIVSGNNLNHELNEIIMETSSGFTYFDADYSSAEKLRLYLLELIEEKKSVRKTLKNSKSINSIYNYKSLITNFIEIILKISINNFNLL